MNALKIPPVCGIGRYQRSNTSMKANRHAGDSVLEKPAVAERSIDY